MKEDMKEEKCRFIDSAMVEEYKRNIRELFDTLGNEYGATYIVSIAIPADDKSHHRIHNIRGNLVDLATHLINLAESGEEMKKVVDISNTYLRNPKHN